MTTLANSRTTDPRTSHQAGASVRGHVPEQHARILYALEHGGPGTCYDIASRFVDRALDGVAVARRLPELQELGRIAVVLDQNGQPVTKIGPNGRACRVWGFVK